jgi:YidC/Oxa1 family membrane protein insertase
LPEIQNPNLQAQGGGSGGGGGDMRGTLLFTLVALVALLGYQFFVKPKQPVAPAPQTQSQAQPAPAVAASGQSSVSSAPQAQLALPQVAAPAEVKSTVENGLYRIVFSNRGAAAESWVLKDPQYKDHPDPGGKQLDLVNAKTKNLGLPLQLFTYEPALTKLLNNDALYQVSTTGSVVNGALQAPGAISFHYAANGIEAVKTFRFDSSYVVTAEVSVKRNGAPVRALLEWPAGLGDQTESLHFAYGKFVWSINGKDDSVDAKKVSGNATLDQPYEYAAFADLYFTAAFLPDNPQSTTVVTLHNSISVPSDPDDPNSQKRPVSVLGLAVGDQSGFTRLRLFAGPKQMELLKNIHATGADSRPDGPSLEPLTQYGMWTIIAKPLYLALRFLRGLLGVGIDNWGWSIIIFTVLFNLIMLPTRVMMMKSSLKMMRIQPKVEALKKRYAHLKPTDPKKAEMNTEMMALYKTEGVNMYGGCLPLLLQMPLFFAYFRVLQNTVELRQAHWFWLTDLSSPDPSHVLPILIIITMFLTQYITPSPGMDPAQRRMMAFMMPVMFGFMLWHYASGLALYWGTGNIINLAIQLGINQSHVGKEMHALAAKRAAKKSGVNPKTIQGRR